MPQEIYKIIENRATRKFKHVTCEDEKGELQDLLESELNLIPGDQINNDDPPQWLLVKREMPVPDPSSGKDRWYIDFFLSDQHAFPTFVECKRYAVNESRREVVGQVLEYAANAHHYWDREQLRELTSTSAGIRGCSVEDEFRRLGITDTEDDYFDRVVENLHEGQLRIIFFLENSPDELRSIVDFLNRQTERTEFLIVEARLFEMEGMRIAVPSVFGYTEQARRIKQRTVSSKSNNLSLSHDKFWSSLEEQTDFECVETTKRLQEAMVKAGYTEKLVGSMQFKLPDVPGKIIVALRTNGAMELYFNHPKTSLIKKILRTCIVDEEVQSKIFNKNKYPRIKWDDWKNQSGQFQQAFERFANEYGEDQGVEASSPDIA